MGGTQSTPDHQKSPEELFSELPPLAQPQLPPDKLQVAAVVATSGQILRLLETEYPAVARSFHYNARGTVVVLAVQGVLQMTSLLETKVEIKHMGTDNFKAWADYRKAIDIHLNKISSEVYLERARAEIVQRVHDKHFVEYPKWPAPGGRQFANIILDAQSLYNYDEYDCQVTVAWYCRGQLEVGDIRPSPRQFLAFVRGHPEIKMLSVDRRRLRRLEQLAANDRAGFQRTVDAACPPQAALTMEGLRANLEIGRQEREKWDGRAAG